MTRPQDPNDPASLSLRPSKSDANPPSFSNVRGSADTTTGSNRAARPDFSNVRSSSSTVVGSGGGADVTPSATAHTYTVESGDTLSHIAQRLYGRASQWRALFEANRDQIDDPDLIHPGQVLKVPVLDRTDD